VAASTAGSPFEVVGLEPEDRAGKSARGRADNQLIPTRERASATARAARFARLAGGHTAPGRHAALTSAATQQACETLSLQLGPLDVTLLGLAVHLDPVNLDVTVVQGAGQRLSSLLCDVSSQLDASTPRADLVRTLNIVLDTIGA
jgi:hypothetical protein